MPCFSEIFTPHCPSSVSKLMSDEGTKRSFLLASCRSNSVAKSTSERPLFILITPYEKRDAQPHAGPQRPAGLIEANSPEGGGRYSRAGRVPALFRFEC